MMTSEACTFGMAGMGLISLLLIVALVLGIWALAKHLFVHNKNSKESSTKNSKGDHEYHSGA